MLWRIIVLIICLTYTGTIHAQLQADFSADIRQGCSPLQVQFTDQSTGGATSWEWSFGPSIANPAFTFLTPGSIDITLIVSNGSESDTMTKVAYLEVIPPPQIDFSGDELSGCNPHTTQFTANIISSHAPITRYSWDFGDGVVSDDEAPSHTYGFGNEFTVALEVEDATGCKAVLSKADYVEVFEKPIVEFESANRVACLPPHEVHFDNLSRGPGQLSFEWDFGDGATSTDSLPSHTYTSSGSFPVKLVVRSDQGCADSISLFNYVRISAPEAQINISDTSLCASPQQDIVTFSEIGAGQGTVTWDYGDGNGAIGRLVNHSYGAAGRYQVIVSKAFDGCVSYDTAYVSVGELDPELTMSASSGCTVPMDVSMNVLGSQGQVQWFIDDGAMYSDSSIVHTFTQIGNNEITIYVESNLGCKDTIKRDFYIEPIDGNLGVDGGKCAPTTQTAQWIEKSDNAIDSIVWYQPRLDTLRGESVEFFLPDSGQYVGYVKVYYSEGCVDSQAFVLVAGIVPTIDFTPLDSFVCIGSDVVMIVTVEPGRIEDVEWKYEDLPDFKVNEHIHTVCVPGYQPVIARGVHLGCSSAELRKDSIIVGLGPVPEFTPSPYNDCDTPYDIEVIQLNDSMIYNRWEVDGQSIPGDTLNYTFDSTGIYRMQFFGYDTISLCTVSKTKFVAVIDPIPQLSISQNEGCAPLFGVEIQTNVDNWFTGIKAQYAPGDGSPIREGFLDSSFLQPITKTYLEGGEFNIEFSVFYDISAGVECKRTASESIRIYDPPLNMITGNGTNFGCLKSGTTILVNERSQFPYVSARYSITDGNVLHGFQDSLLYHFPDTGIYVVKLEVEDSVGCVDSTNLQVSVQQPTSDFNFNLFSVCSGTPIQFQSSSTGVVEHYFWDFGDGGSDTIADPEYVYDSGGTYRVQLVIEDIYQCRDTLLHNTPIDIQQPRAKIGVSDTLNSCPPFDVSFFDESEGNIQAWFWDLGDNTQSIKQHPDHKFIGVGTYDVMLAVRDDRNCTDTVFINDLITVQGPSGVYTAEVDSGCERVEVAFSIDSAQDLASVQWDFGDGTTSDQMMVTHEYTESGAYRPVIILSNADGCKVVDTLNLSLNIEFLDVDFTKSEQFVCGAAEVVYRAQIEGNPTNITWNFNYDNSSTSGVDTLSKYVDVPGFYTMRVVVRDANGCVAEHSETIIVHELPAVALVEDTFNLCPNTPFTMEANFDSHYRYIWYPVDITDSTDTFFTQALAQKDTTYHVVVIDENGCAARSQDAVLFVYEPAYVEISDDTTINLDDRAHLRLRGDSLSSYSWWPAGGMLSDSGSYWVSPFSSTEYFVAGTDTNGCATDTLSVWVEVIDLYSVAMPTAFTPNQDGVNEGLLVRGIGIAELLEFSVYNRWGELIFHTTDLNEAWMGTNAKGRPQVMDNYSYVVRVLDRRGREKQAQGMVALIR